MKIKRKHCSIGKKTSVNYFVIQMYQIYIRETKKQKLDFRKKWIMFVYLENIGEISLK